MRIDLLRAHHLRCFSAVEVAPGPGFNWLVGPNGAGKTTLLEAVYLLSHGHSFRAGARDALVQRGRAGFDLFAELSRAKSRHRMGLARGEGEWRVQIDGEPRATLSPLLELCAVVCFEPGSHALIAGAAYVGHTGGQLVYKYGAASAYANPAASGGKIATTSGARDNDE